MAILDRRPPDVTPPRPLTMLRREADVRQIGSATFRDTQPARQTEAPVPEPEWVRRARAGSLPVKVFLS